MLSREQLESLPETLKFGSLINKRDYDKEKIDILLQKLYNQNQCIAVLRSLLGSDEKLIETLDIMAGYVVKFPTHTTIIKYINEIDIWTTLRRQSPTEANIKAVAVNYKMPTAKVKNVYEMYENEFGDGDSGKQDRE